MRRKALSLSRYLGVTVCSISWVLDVLFCETHVPIILTCLSFHVFFIFTQDFYGLVIVAFCIMSISDSDSISQNVPASLIKGPVYRGRNLPLDYS